MFPPDSDSSAGSASIRYSREVSGGLPTLSAALASLKDGGHLPLLKVVIVNGGFDAEFQRELLEQLHDAVPTELAIALVNPDDGTYENAQLAPIHKAFDEVALETTFVEGISAELAAVGKRIARVSHEKLSFRYFDDELAIFFFLYLEVEDQ